jgi:hypothetical protein
MGSGAGPKPNVDGLIYEMDSSNPRSYAGTGVSLIGLVRNINGTLFSGVNYGTINKGAFIFDGTDDYIEFDTPGTGVSFGNASDYNITSWVYVNSTQVRSNPSIIEKYNGTGGYPIAIRWFGQQISAIIYDGTNGAAVGTTCLTNTWLNVSVNHILTQKRLELYVNGLIGSTSTYTTMNNISSASSTKIGYRGFDSNTYFTGRVSNVEIYSRALSSTEILQKYNTSKSKYSKGEDIITDGLVSAFDIGSTATYSGTGSTIISTVSPQYTADFRDGVSVVGTGSTTYINFSGSTANVLYFSTNTFRSVSFVAWISSSISGANYIFDGRNGIGAYLYYAGTGGISALYVNGASKDPSSTSNNTTVFPRNQWLNIYIELSSIGTGAVSFGNRFSFNEPFTGRMSAFQFYNRQLTAAEIKQNYDAFRGRYS